VKRTLQVHLGDESRRVGTLHYDQNGAREHGAFAYDEAWLAAKERFALDPTLPLVAGAQFHRKMTTGSVFHAAFADTEPDGWGRRVILRDHAKRRQSARRAAQATGSVRLNAVDFLLAVDDGSRVGALRFRDEDGVFQRAAEPGRRTAPPLLELGHLLAASRAVEDETETAADLAYLRGRGTSLGGLRPKCTVVDDDGWLAIGKFPSVQDERAVTKGEVLAMTLAKKAGLAVAATLLGVESAGPEEHYYTEIVDAVRMHGAAVRDDLEELWRRMAFGILITNVDDHLRNHGFLHAEAGLWRLAPAFDLNPFPDRARELKTWVSAETGPEATVEALMSVRAYFQIPAKRAKEILAEVERAVAGWRKVARALGMTDRDLDDFADAFEHPQRGVARRVAAKAGPG
jgi:serine/threonine-protein kinase HipA